MLGVRALFSSAGCVMGLSRRWNLSVDQDSYACRARIVCTKRLIIVHENDTLFRMDLPAKLDDHSAKTIPHISHVLELIPTWLAAIDTSDTTRTTYQQGARMFFRWLDDNPQPVDAGTVKAWRDAIRQDYAVGTVNVWLSSIRSFFGWLAEERLIPFNPAVGIKGAKRRGTAKAHKRDELTSSEIRQVLALIDTSQPTGARDHAIVTLMAYCGLRTVEVHRADLEDIQTRNGRAILWVQGKGAVEKDDFVVLPTPAEEALHLWRAVHPLARQQPQKGQTRPLFCSFSDRSFGRRLSTSYIRRMVKKWYYLAGITSARKTTHSLRHSAISSAIRNGGDLLQVQAMARHADPKTTMVYYHEIGRTDNPAEDLVKH